MAPRSACQISSIKCYQSKIDTNADNIAVRQKKGSDKSTSSVKAKTTKKRAFPQEGENATESLPDASTVATGKKPSKRPRSSTVVVADVEGSFCFCFASPLILL
jgi:hypothetical protein